MLTIFFRDRIFSTKYAPHIHMVFEVQGNTKAKLDAMEEQVADIISKYSKDGIVIGNRRDEKGTSGDIWLRKPSISKIYRKKCQNLVK